MDGSDRPGRLLAGGLAVIFVMSACGTAPSPPATPLEISEPIVTSTTAPTSTTTPVPTTTTTTTTPPPEPQAPPAPKPPPPKQQPLPKPKPPAPQGNCDPSYPTVCIPPEPPDLNCGDIPHRRFKVLAPDPHGFDGSDNDGIGCESG